MTSNLLSVNVIARLCFEFLSFQSMSCISILATDCLKLLNFNWAWLFSEVVSEFRKVLWHFRRLNEYVSWRIWVKEFYHKKVADQDWLAAISESMRLNLPNRKRGFLNKFLCWLCDKVLQGHQRRMGASGRSFHRECSRETRCQISRCMAGLSRLQGWRSRAFQFEWCKGLPMKFSRRSDHLV